MIVPSTLNVDKGIIHILCQVDIGAQLEPYGESKIVEGAIYDGTTDLSDSLWVNIPPKCSLRFSSDPLRISIGPPYLNM